MQEQMNLLVTQKDRDPEDLSGMKAHDVSTACEWKRLRSTTHLETTANFEGDCMGEMCLDSSFFVYAAIYTGQSSS